MATVIDELVTVISNRYEGNKDIQSALDGYKRLNRGFQDTVRNMAKGAAILGAALTGVGAVVIKATVPYEQALNDLRAFAEVTQDELDQLDDQARKIGSSGRFGATDVLEGQREFLRNQFSVNETLEATPHLEHLAAAGMMDMDKAANLVAHTLRRFDLGADQVQHVTDVLASMTRETGLNLADLEATFRRAALVADRLNMSFEETAAGVSLLAREGLRPREAGSLLEAMLEDLTDLSEESKEAAQELSRVGLDVDLVKGLASTGQVTKLFDELRKAGADINQIFSTLGIDAAQILFDAGDEFAQLADQFLTAEEGTAQDMKETRDLGLPGAIEDFKSAINALQLSVGSSGLTGMLEWVLDKLAAFVRWLSEASGWLKGFAVAAIAAGPVLLGLAAATKIVTFAARGFVVLVKIARGAVWLWRNALILTRIQMGLLSVQTWWANSALSRFAATIWTSSVGALKALATKLTMAGAAMLRFSGRAIAAGIAGVVAFAASIWTGAVPALAAFAAGVWATTVAMLANPVGLIVLGIVGLIAALVLLVKHWDTVTDALKFAWSWIKGNWPLLASILLGPFGIVGALIWKFRDQIVGALKFAWSWIKGNWPLLVGILLGPFGIVGALVWKFRDQILGAFREVWDWLRESPIFSPVIDGIQAIIDFVRELPGKVKDAVKDIPNMVTDAVKDIPVVGQVLDVAGGVADKAKGFLGGIGKVFTGAAGGVVPGQLGRAVPSIIHGGEMVLPPGASNVLAQMLEGFRLGPAALPQAPHYYGQMYRSSVTNRTVNINITEPIVIQTQATEAKGIAQELHEAIQDQIRNVAYDHDGPVER